MIKTRMTTRLKRQKTQELDRENREIRAVLWAVATQPVTTLDAAGRLRCPYCPSAEDRWDDDAPFTSEHDGARHAASCAVTRARALVAQMTTRKGA